MKYSIITIALLLNLGFMNQMRESQKYKLIIFEGSDWCANCIRLEKKILSDTSFVQFLNHKNIELLKIDFPQRKKLSNEQTLYNSQISEKYNFDGTFPTVIITRSDTLLFERIFYQNQSVEEIKAVIHRKLQVLQ